MTWRWGVHVEADPAPRSFRGVPNVANFDLTWDAAPVVLDNDRWVGAKYICVPEDGYRFEGPSQFILWRYVDDIDAQLAALRVVKVDEKKPVARVPQAAQQKSGVA